jgi:hypothetical protein
MASEDTPTFPVDLTLDEMATIADSLGFSLRVHLRTIRSVNPESSKGREAAEAYATANSALDAVRDAMADVIAT